MTTKPTTRPTTKFSKSELKNPDKMTEELRKGFSWSVEHSKLVIFILAGLVVFGGSYSIYKYFQDKTESELQEKYYQTEREYFDLKEKYELAEQPASTKAEAAKTKDSKEAQPEAKGVKSSGDIEKDYGSIIKAWNLLVDQAPSSKAATMASLHLSEVYTKYQKKDAALKALEKIKSKSGLLTALAMDRKASLQADLGDCKSALLTWDQVLKNNNAIFLGPEINLKKGLCFESLNDLPQAQAMYSQAKESDSKSPLAKTAEKYLRLLQAKKN